VSLRAEPHLHVRLATFTELIAPYPSAIRITHYDIEGPMESKSHFVSLN
jgi:hypothetical protein